MSGTYCTVLREGILFSGQSDATNNRAAGLTYSVDSVENRTYAASRSCNVQLASQLGYNNMQTMALAVTTINFYNFAPPPTSPSPLPPSSTVVRGASTEAGGKAST